MKKLLSTLMALNVLAVTPISIDEKNNSSEIQNEKLNLDTIKNKAKSILNSGDILDLSQLKDFEDIFSSNYFNASKYKWINGENKESFDEFVLNDVQSFIDELFTGYTIGTDPAGTEDILITLSYADNKDLELVESPMVIRGRIVFKAHSERTIGVSVIGFDFVAPAKIYDFSDSMAKLQSIVNEKTWLVDDFKDSTFWAELDSLLETSGLGPNWESYPDFFESTRSDKQGIENALTKAGIKTEADVIHQNNNGTSLIVRIQLRLDKTAENYRKTYIVSGTEANLEINFGLKYYPMGEEVVDTNAISVSADKGGGWWGHYYDEDSGWVTIANMTNFDGYVDYGSIEKYYSEIELWFNWSHNGSTPKNENSTHAFPTEKDKEVEIKSDSWTGSLHSMYYTVNLRVTSSGLVQLFVKINGYVAAHQNQHSEFEITKVVISPKGA